MTSHRSISLFGIIPFLLIHGLLLGQPTVQAEQTAEPQPKRNPLSRIFSKKARPSPTPATASPAAPTELEQASKPQSRTSPPQSLYNLGRSGSSTVSAGENAAPTARRRTESQRTRATKSIAEVSDYGKSTGKSESSTGSQTISSWPTGRKLVALTYDDGPHPTITPKLIELLKSKNTPATFFLLGQSVKAYPAIARQLAENGFEVGNHSFSHPQLTKLSDEAIRRELTQCAELITSATGGAPIRVMRPTYGAHNERVRRIANEMGYKIILWDVDTNDWRKRTTDQMVATILSSATDGSIILMHDRYPTTLETTAAVIDELRARGFTFVTVSEMLEQPRVAPNRKQEPRRL